MARGKVGLASLLAVACASAPTPREAAELSLTAAAEVWSVWLDAEATKAERLPEPARAARLRELVRDNERWDAAESAFAAAWTAYEVAREAWQDRAPTALDRARLAELLDRAHRAHAHAHALALLHAAREGGAP